MTLSSEGTPVRVFGQIDQAAIERRAETILVSAFHLSPSDWAAERSLILTKWFDYHFLSPAEATQAFVEEYTKIYRQKWAQNFDVSVANKKRGIAAGGLFHSRKEFREFWNARVQADVLGVPYWLYISTAMEVALRRAKQKRLLRAGQMRRMDCVEAIEKRWDDELAGSRWLSELSHYRTENYCSLPSQVAHREHVSRAVRKRPNALIELGMAIDNSRVLPVDKAEAFHGTELVASARERANGIGTPEPVEMLADDKLIPSCFGLPSPLDVTEEPCNRCPLVAQCQQASEHMLADVIAQYGSGDPLLHHRRKNGKERARRCREKKRLAKAVMIQPKTAASVEGR